jgi:hypothetical protein
MQEALRTLVSNYLSTVAAKCRQHCRRHLAEVYSSEEEATYDEPLSTASATDDEAARRLYYLRFQRFPPPAL